MARQKKKIEQADENVVDYRHKSVKRLNIPPAGLAARGEIVREKKVRYAYNPHLSPALRFDATGKADSIEKLIEDAARRKLAVNNWGRLGVWDFIVCRDPAFIPRQSAKIFAR